MSATLDRRQVTDALASRLADRIGWADIEVAARALPPPVVIIDPLQGGTVQRMLGARATAAAGSMPYQLTCVGVPGASGRQQAEHLAWEAVDALVGWTDDLIGLVTVDAWGNVRPDRDADPPVWISQPMIRVTATT